jgi:hypothetical protein
VGTIALAPTAHADPTDAPGADPVPVVPIPVPPGPSLCGTADTPPCAPAAPFTVSPDLACLLIAWRTRVPCNWWGFGVPEGTPGSVG